MLNYYTFRAESSPQLWRLGTSSIKECSRSRAAAKVMAKANDVALLMDAYVSLRNYKFFDLSEDNEESMETIQSFLGSPAHSSSAPPYSSSAPPSRSSAPPSSSPVHPSSFSAPTYSFSAPPPSTSPSMPNPQANDTEMAAIEDLLASDSDEELSTSPPEHTRDCGGHIKLTRLKPTPKKIKVDKGKVGKAIHQGKQRLKEVGEKAKTAKKKAKSSNSKEKRKDPAKLPNNDTTCKVCQQSFFSCEAFKGHTAFCLFRYFNFMPNNDTMCEVCQQSFFTFEAFERHIAEEHKLGCPFSKTCELIFVHQFDLDLHLFEGHGKGLRPKGSFEARGEERQVVEAEEAGLEDFIGLEDLEAGADLPCDLFEEDELEERFPCTVFASLQEHKLHQVEGHKKERCHVAECSAAFETRRELGAHLRRQHQVLETMEIDGGVSVHLTTARSQENVDNTQWVEAWIRSDMATKYLVSVMAARTYSKRHFLFLNRDQREQCSGAGTSKLWSLSNPGFLGGGNETDTAVIKQLIDEVFLPNLANADQRLRNMMNDKCVFEYATCVLFPETFIYQHQVWPDSSSGMFNPTSQVQGKTREEAEMLFLEMAVDAEERVGLTDYVDDHDHNHLDLQD